MMTYNPSQKPPFWFLLFCVACLACIFLSFSSNKCFAAGVNLVPSSFSLSDYPFLDKETAISYYLVSQYDDTNTHVFVAKSTKDNTLVIFENKDDDLIIKDGVITAKDNLVDMDYVLQCNTHDATYSISGSTVSVSYDALCYNSSADFENLEVIAANYELKDVSSDELVCHSYNWMGFYAFVIILWRMVSFSTILTFLGLGLVAAGVFVLGWMGVKKLIKILKNALIKGKMEV